MAAVVGVAGSVLCLLIVEGVIVNVVLARRDGVTVGTDDDGPGLRLAVVAAGHGRAGRRRWWSATRSGRCPTATLRDDSAEVVGIASSVAEASRDVHTVRARRRRSTGRRR